MKSEIDSQRAFRIVQQAVSLTNTQGEEHETQLENFGLGSHQRVGTDSHDRGSRCFTGAG
jgi:hypothetical protein